MKLTLELMPSTAWLHSLHTYLTAKAWNTLRKKVLEEYNHECGICGANPGQLNCHEQWEYDDETLTQRLVRLIMLCQMCHMVKHMNQRGASFDEKAEHFMRVNGCSRQEFDAYYQQCCEEQTRREFRDDGGPVLWEQDWGEYVSFLSKGENLKQRYQWHNGYIVSVGSSIRKPRSHTD